MSQPVQFPLHVSILPTEDNRQIALQFVSPFGQYTQFFPVEMVTDKFIQEMANGLVNAVQQAKRNQLGLVLPKGAKG